MIHDRDQIFGLHSRQQSTPINFCLNQPQQHDCNIDNQNFQLDHDFGVDLSTMSNIVRNSVIK